MNDPRWRKSRYSGSNGGGCVEAGNHHPNGVMIRDTQDPRWPDSAPVIEFNAEAWTRFTASLK